MTRWHEDDLVGRLLEAQGGGGDRWEVVNLPALAEAGDPLGRPEGAALCPDRFDEEALARIAAVQGNSFHALYQGRPTAKRGEFFERDWLPIVACGPVEADRVRFWDKAGTTDGDWTAGVRVARTKEGLWFVEDVVRVRLTAGPRERVIRQTAELDGVAVRILVEQEGGSGGKESAEATIRNLAGFDARSETASTGPKESRASPFAAQAEAGNVRLIRGPWNKAYIEELTGFPRGKHDDQVDASSGAFNALARVHMVEVW